jgi:hypothetical protein
MKEGEVKGIQRDEQKQQEQHATAERRDRPLTML